jgi:hypothetical protein
MLFAEPATRLILEGTFAKLVRSSDYPWGYPQEAEAGILADFESRWGTGDVLTSFFPSAASDPGFRAACARWERNSASPGALRSILSLIAKIDVRPILGSIGVPTLVVHGARDPVIDVAHGRYLAARIPGARYLELPIGDHDPLGAELEGFLARVEEFLTEAVRAPSRDRVLATSSSRTSSIRPATRAASETRAGAPFSMSMTPPCEVRSNAIGVRSCSRRETVFSRSSTAWPAPSSVRAAASTAEALGLAIRAGVHTGECERRGDNVGGLAVHIGARVTAMAAAGEVLVSRTVKDLVAGSRLRFADRGKHPLRFDHPRPR